MVLLEYVEKQELPAFTSAVGPGGSALSATTHSR